MSFTFNIKQKEPLVLSLYGELVDRDECRDMINLIEETCQQENAWIIFDLSDLRAMNSTGLNILINALTMARKSGGEVWIAGVSEKVRKLFIITKLNTIFHVHESEEDALTAYGAAASERKSRESSSAMLNRIDEDDIESETEPE
jgi:anti-sigma B factor antagonist